MISDSWNQFTSLEDCIFSQLGFSASSLLQVASDPQSSEALNDTGLKSQVDRSFYVAKKKRQEVEKHLRERNSTNQWAVTVSSGRKKFAGSGLGHPQVFHLSVVFCTDVLATSGGFIPLQQDNRTSCVYARRGGEGLLQVFAMYVLSLLQQDQALNFTYTPEDVVQEGWKTSFFCCSDIWEHQFRTMSSTCYISSTVSWLLWKEKWLRKLMFPMEELQQLSYTENLYLIYWRLIYLACCP